MLRIRPTITHLAGEKYANRPSKPTARGTAYRYSSSGACAKQIAYMAMNTEPDEPLRAEDAWQMMLGELIHVSTQEAAMERFPNAVAEFTSKSANGLVSGSCDLLVPVTDFPEPTRLAWEFQFGGIGTHVVYELKTMTSFPFDKQVGWSRMRGTVNDDRAEGPKHGAIAQAGMNALGIMHENKDIDIQLLILGSACVETLSRSKAKNMDVEGVDRMVAEWVIPRREWEGAAQNELDRIENIHETLVMADMPRPFARDDDGYEHELNPFDPKLWNCEYCPFQERCKKSLQ